MRREPVLRSEECPTRKTLRRAPMAEKKEGRKNDHSAFNLLAYSPLNYACRIVKKKKSSMPYCVPANKDITCCLLTTFGGLEIAAWSELYPWQKKNFFFQRTVRHCSEVLNRMPMKRWTLLHVRLIETSNLPVQLNSGCAYRQPSSQQQVHSTKFTQFYLGHSSETPARLSSIRRIRWVQ